MFDILFKKSIFVLFLHSVRVVSFFIFYKLILYAFGSDFSSSYAIIDSWVLIITSLVSFGFNETVLRLFKDFNSDLKLFLIQYIKIFLPIFFITIPLVLLFSTKQGLDFYYFIPIFVLINIFTIVINGIIRTFNYVVYANLFENLFPLFLLILTVLIVLFDYSNINVFHSWIFSKLFVLFLAFLFLLFFVSMKNISLSSSITIKSLLIIALPILIANFSIVALNEIPVIFLGINSNSVDILSFKIGFKIASLMWLIQFSFYNIIAPTIPKIFAEKKYKELSEIVIKQTKNSFFLNFIYFFFLVFFGDYILHFISPDITLDFMTMFVLSITYLMNSLFGPIGLLFQITKYEKNYMFLMMFLFILLIIIGYPISKNFGSLGMSFLIFFLFLLRNIYARYFFIKVFGRKLSLV